MINIKILTPIALFFTNLSFASYAMEFDKAYIENLAKSHVEKSIPVLANKKVNITVSKIDPRVNIKPCQSPLSANIPENSKGRNVNVKISCSDSISWQLYIPVRIKTMVELLVATSTISKGSVLDTDNTAIIFKDEATLRGEIISHNNGILGAKAKRGISKGSAITKRNICLVCKGESVTIIARSKSFLIKTTGTALSNGAVGDQVRVKNKQTGRTVTGKVKAINQVVITL